MKKPDQPLTEDQEILELGVTLGQRRAFGMVAGRCSAAHAECLRKIREEKRYLRFAKTWEEYCDRHLKMSRRSADRIIGQLKEFGTLYFEVAELTGITPNEYRAIAGSIDKEGIHASGEVIALIPANTTLAIEAVARLQAEARPAEAAPATAVEEQIAALEKRGHQLADSFRRVAKSAGEFERQTLVSAVKKVQRTLGRVELEVG